MTTTLITVNAEGGQILRCPDTDKTLYRVDYDNRDRTFVLAKILTVDQPLKGCNRFAVMSRHPSMEGAQYAALSHRADALTVARFNATAADVEEAPGKPTRHPLPMDHSRL